MLLSTALCQADSLLFKNVFVMITFPILSEYAFQKKKKFLEVEFKTQGHTNFRRFDKDY